MSRAVTLVWRPGCASCAAAKEFLTVNGVAFESVNPVEPGGAARWEELGYPRIPSIVLDGASTAIYHVSQVAALLGMTPSEGGDVARLAWDLATVLEAWSAELAAISWDLMVSATPSRGRSVRNLTVNVHEPVREMTLAWEGGVFTWDTDKDESRCSELRDASEVRAYAESRTAGWITFLMDLGDAIMVRDPPIKAGDETVRFSSLLDAQRFHAAFHYRQLRTFLAERGVAPAQSLDLERLPGLRLPKAVF